MMTAVSERAEYRPADRFKELPRNAGDDDLAAHVVAGDHDPASKNCPATQGMMTSELDRGVDAPDRRLQRTAPQRRG